MRVSLRPSLPTDYDYCARLYFEEMERTIRDLNLDMATHAERIRQLWTATEVRIITLDGADVGWLQTRPEADALFIAQLFVERSFQGRGIGTDVVRHLIREAADAGLSVTLGVVKSNPAQRLYKRLGFHVTHEDERKFYMRRELDLKD